MVYLVITREGLQQLLPTLTDETTAVWCSADALTPAEFERLARGNITRFDYSIAGADNATVASAVQTIEEHHPGERVWIEAVFS